MEYKRVVEDEEDVEEEEEEEDSTPSSFHHHSAFTRSLPSSSASLLHTRPPAETRNATTSLTQQIPHSVISSYYGSSAAGRSGLNSTTAITTAVAAASAAVAEQTEAYRECLRNHAASLGGHILDGCCEFMPRDEDALRCAACGCHRSFHRKETDPVSTVSGMIHQNGAHAMRRFPLPLPQNAAHSYYYQQMQFNARPFAAAGSHYGASGGMAMNESSSEEMMNLGVGLGGSAQVQVKTRSRTKFTAEQKERMLAFAESVGWRMQKQDEVAVQQFCNEVGVSRQVLKVWMHNNKSMRKQQAV